jgi:hypothetical protein
MQHYNFNKIKSKRSYNSTEISALLGINRKTFNRWIKGGGLRVIERDVSPILVMGADLIEFIKKKRLRRKIPIKDNEFYCLKCRRAVKPKKGSEQTIKTGNTIGKDNHELFRFTAVCEFCGKEINRYSGVSHWD